ncbi:hypothetical protein Tco_1218224 [Tanacetum coccineum]
MSSSSSNLITIDVNYNGIFYKNSLRYSLGVVKSIDHVDVGGMDFNDLREFFEELTRSKCIRLYYCVPRKTLCTGLRIIEFDLDVYRLLEHGISNGGRIGLYVDHYDENLTEFIAKDNLTDLIVGVDAATSDVGTDDSDPSYQLSDEDDDRSDLILLVQEEDDDDDDDDDVSTLSQTINDPFLTRLCYDNMDNDVEEQVDSDENWSANEEDDESDGVQKFIEPGVLYPTCDPNINWKSMKSILGMLFESCKQLKESMIDYGVSNGYELVFLVNDYRRLLVRCGKEEIDYEDDSMGKNDEKGDNGVDNNSDQDGMGINNEIEKDSADIMRKYKCKVSMGQCSRAKKKALHEYERGLKEHYARLSDYGTEIMETNPGSTVKMCVNTSDGNNYFSIYYVCFKGVKDGWINGCRKVIGLDGCFLKSVCQGQLLAAMGRYANNHIFPLAWAVVSVKNKENWKWFLTQLRDDTGMIDGVGLTLISDQHKIPKFSHIPPDARIDISRIANEYKGIMPTKIKLTLEQSQQGVSDDVLSPMHYPESADRKHFNGYSLVFTVTNGNPSRVNLKQLCSRYKRQCCSPIPPKLDSLPHTHTQAFKVNHSASRLLILNFLIIKELQTFGRHLKEIHTLWTQFGKKRDKIATLHEDDEELAYNAWRRRHKSL